MTAALARSHENFRALPHSLRSRLNAIMPGLLPGVDLLRNEAGEHPACRNSDRQSLALPTGRGEIRPFCYRNTGSSKRSKYRTLVFAGPEQQWSRVYCRQGVPMTDSPPFHRPWVPKLSSYTPPNLSEDCRAKLRAEASDLSAIATDGVSGAASAGDITISRSRRNFMNGYPPPGDPPPSLTYF